MLRHHIKLHSFPTAFILLLLTLGATSASAALVVSDVATGDGSEALFGTDIMQSGENGSTLTLELNEFVADGGGFGVFGPVTVTDTVTMTLTAPEGYFITGFVYNEAGNANVGFASFAEVTGSITVGGIPVNFNNELITPDSGMVSWSIDPIALALVEGVESVTVTITNTLSAVAFEPPEDAIIEKTEAILQVGLTPVPVPAAVWLFGSAVLGLVGMSRHKRS